MQILDHSDELWKLCVGYLLAEWSDQTGADGDVIR